MDSQYSPSFSSSLLDAVYRSIDQGDEKMREAIRRTTAGNSNYRPRAKSEEEMANFRRACMIEKWMEKKATEKAVVRRKSAADSQTKKPRKSDRTPTSSWSDPAGGGGGGFESESFPLPRPKPVRTAGSGFEKDLRTGGSDPKHEGGFLKTKSRALKIYGDLKKVKQPISPGGKLAGFLNSIFTGAGKSKISSASGESPSLKSTSTCSSASPFSRSCLSKTPSSRGKKSSRSVRFSQVDEEKFEGDSRRIRNVINEELMVHVMEKNQVARELLRNYQMKTKVTNEAFDRDLDDDDDDDAASYASSDLFELDNLERYREELPVYESTRLDLTNRAGGLVF